MKHIVHTHVCIYTHMHVFLYIQSTARRAATVPAVVYYSMILLDHFFHDSIILLSHVVINRCIDSRLASMTLAPPVVAVGPQPAPQVCSNDRFLLLANPVRETHHGNVSRTWDLDLARAIWAWDPFGPGSHLLGFGVGPV